MCTVMMMVRLCKVMLHSRLTRKGAKCAVAQGAAGFCCDEQERLLPVAQHPCAAGRQLYACDQPGASMERAGQQPYDPAICNKQQARLPLCLAMTHC